MRHGGSGATGAWKREVARAELDQMLVGELTGVLKRLVEEIGTTRTEMHYASGVASRHTRAVGWATWVLAVATGVLVIMTWIR
jgi:hypothetical protein